MARTPNTEITEKQKLILEFIEKYYQEHSDPPTIRTICQEIGCNSLSSVHFHMQQLSKFGFVVQANDGSKRWYPASADIPTNTASKRKISSHVSPEATITAKQKKVLDFIEQYYLEHNVPPTIRTICDAFGFSSKSTASFYLNRLSDLGYVKQSNDHAKRWYPANAGAPSVEAKVPVINCEIKKTIPRFVSYSGIDNPNDYFAYYVDSNKLEAIHILKGDIVIAKREKALKSGEIVIAQQNDVPTCWLYYKKHNGEEFLRTDKTNSDMEEFDEYEILGVAKTIIRNL